jgi:AmmeMemoRadiSam system protein A
LSDADYDKFSISRSVDHGALVPLHFIGQAYRDFKLTLMNYGTLSPLELYSVGMTIRETIEEQDETFVVIASGDLSHRLADSGPYEFHPDGRRFDEKFLRALEEGDYETILFMDEKLCRNAGECGKRSAEILLGVLDGNKSHGEVLSYEGPYGVGYGVVRFEIIEGDVAHSLYGNIRSRAMRDIKKVREGEDRYVRLARKTIELYVKTKTRLEPDAEDVSEEMTSRKAGVFVSIKKHGSLRGWICTSGHTQANIAVEIIRNAIEASSKDPRFFPVEEEEIEALTVSVDILGEAEPVVDISELNPQIYGVIVTSGYKRGLLLPDLEGVDTVEEQLRIALSKAGIQPSEPYDIEKFVVERHH